MIKFVISRIGKQYYDMMTKWDWLEKNFGKCSYDQSTWAWEWYDNTDDYVNFVFYNESMATWFKLQFPDVQTTREFEDASYSF